MSRLSRFLISRWGPIVTGATVTSWPSACLPGQPGAWDLRRLLHRDIAGALGLHRAAVVQYLRRIPGFICSLIAA